MAFVPSLYASTFVSGMQEVVSDALRQSLPSLRIQCLDDGIILYTTVATVDAIQSLRCCNNTFAVLSFCEKLPAKDSLKHLVKSVRADDRLPSQLRLLLPKGGGYSLLASMENQPVSIPFLLREKLERSLRAAGPLVRDRKNPHYVLTLFIRREGYGFLGLRLTREQHHNHVLQKGELRPSLAHLLCLLSEPSTHDRFLDSFCGSGAIPIERAKFFPFKEIWATDSNPTLIRQLHERVKNQKSTINVDCFDARKLTSFRNGYFTKIVTDPPWGLYERKDFDLGDVMKELCRVTDAGGIIVLLLSRQEPFQEILRRFSSEIALVRAHNILVSGQKATIYKMKVIDTNS